jgi:hypothetical protein
MPVALHPRRGLALLFVKTHHGTAIMIRGVLRTDLARRYGSDAAILLVLLLITGAVYFSTMRPGHNWGGDFSMYIIHARNLVEGRSYYDTGYLLDPEIPLHVHAPPSYPPVFPALLAPLYKAYGLNYYAFKALVQAMLLAALAFTYIVARQRGLSPWSAGAVVAVFGFSGIVLDIKESVLSETTYLAVAGATVCLAVWIYQRGWDKRYPARAAAALVTLVLIAYATRVAGLALVLALGGYEVLVARRLRPFNLYLAAGLALGLILYTKFIYDGRGYSNEFGFTPRTYLVNALYYVRSPASMWGSSPRPLRWPMTGALLALATAGFLRSLKRPSFVEFYVAASIAPLIVYTSGHGDRYLLGVMPFLLIYAAEGFSWLAGHIAPAARRIAIVTLAAVLLLATGLNLAHMETGPITDGIEKPSFQQLYRFIRNGTPENSRFIFWNPRVLALYTNHASAWYPHTEDTDRFLRFMRRIQTAYVILYGMEPADAVWLRPHIERARDQFELVYRNEDFEVYCLKPL